MPAQHRTPPEVEDRLFDTGACAPPRALRLDRIVHAPPERVYRAFLEPVPGAKWVPPQGLGSRAPAQDARRNGCYRASAAPVAFGVPPLTVDEVHQFHPHPIIRYQVVYDDAGGRGVMVTTVTLRDSAVGTALRVLQEGIPRGQPLVAFCRAWQEALALLAQTVETGGPPAAPAGAREALSRRSAPAR